MNPQFAIRNEIIHPSVQQFTVPQFIDVEDKIIGPVTTRQFFVSLAGMLLIFVVYRVTDFSLFVLLGVLLLIATAVVAFLRINGRTFHEFLLDLIHVLKRPRMRMWKKTPESSSGLSLEHLPRAVPASSRVRTPERAARTISELALLVDTGGLIHQREEA